MVGVHTPNKPENYYGWRPDHLKHLSAGAVIVNDNGLILTIYLERVDARYFLPTKTHSPGKSLEETLAETSNRTGWEIEIVDYLGSTIAEFPTPESEDVTKSVVWFKCKPVREVPRDPEDRDADAEIQWKSREELTKTFASQANISSDMDQRQVLSLLDK